jgi:purine-nucleoside phosphorylase
VLISDHLNLTAASPIEGANFVDLTDLSTRPACAPLPAGSTLASMRASTCSSAGPTTRRRPRCRWPRILGGDLVGMSTTLEAIAARQRGLEVLGISLVTNLAAGISKTPLSTTRRSSRRVARPHRTMRRDCWPRWSPRSLKVV